MRTRRSWRNQDRLFKALFKPEDQNAAPQGIGSNPSHGKLPSECFHCSAPGKDLRPYGPKGAYVCFACAMQPANKATTEQSFGALLDASGPVSVLTPEGPVPFEGGKQ